MHEVEAMKIGMQSEKEKWWEGQNTTTTSLSSAICPDLLELDDIGEADNLRGRVVRAFFWFMKVWKP